MGIPSYFSYIIKNHSNIIRNLHYHQNVVRTAFTSLYMDCNSIIYDAFRDIEKTYTASPSEHGDIETVIIAAVIQNIKKYVSFIKPSQFLFIAFDGVAPFAKMEQQRTRRYKSQFMTKVNFTNTKSTIKPVWNTAAITPGTHFMNRLSQMIAQEFSHKESHYGIKKIIVSGSDEPGEGEHKMYAHLRKNTRFTDQIAIYGLDSDLIMLSIFHLEYCKNMYIFREAPVFGDLGKSANNHKPNLPLFLDIDILSSSILREMDCPFPDKHRVYDYVFLCFFLGNDFLPHFPALNIRTHGIQVLLDTYRSIFGKQQDQYIIDKTSKQILWKNVHTLIKDLAKNEHTLLQTEYTVRNKWDGRKWPQSSNGSAITEKDCEDMLTSVPVIYRAEEKYIQPQEPFWEDRYYKALFHHHPSNEIHDFRKNICLNYLEGLEWVYTYYTDGCPDWKWKYNYHYPPLLADLTNHVPKYQHRFITAQNTHSFSPYTQLSYVLPPEQLTLLPDDIQTLLKNKYAHFFPKTMEFQWAFCRYFWEAHSINNPITLPMLEGLDAEFATQN